MQYGYNNLFVKDPFIFRSTASGVGVYDLDSDYSLGFIFSSPVLTSSVWADNDNIYFGTFGSGVLFSPLSSLASGIFNDVYMFKREPEILSNYINYLHGNSNYLLLTSSSGVNRIDLDTGLTISGVCVDNYSYFNSPYVFSEMPGWSYRKSFTLSRPSGAVYNYQMGLNVGQQSLIYCDIHCDNLCNSDFSDIRFTDSTGVNQLSYYIEYLSGSSPYKTARVWVKCPYIGTESTTFYMYYGNTSASSASNGYNTFIVFDDFERGGIGDALGSPWVVTAGNVFISTEVAYEGTRCLELQRQATGTAAQIPVTPSSDISICLRIYSKDNAAITYFAHGDGGSRVQFEYLCDSGNGTFYYLNSSNTYVSISSALTPFVWHKIEIRDFNWSSNTFSVYANGSLLGSSLSERSGTTASGVLQVWKDAAYYDASRDTFFDQIFVRYYLPTGPSFGTVSDPQYGVDLWYQLYSSYSSDQSRFFKCWQTSSGRIYFIDNESSNSNWLGGWSYRKRVSLSRSTGAVSNYQMKLLVGESSGATGESVDCGGLCKFDFSDLRFTKADGVTLLDYWIEIVTGTTPNQLATIWIEFDYIGTTSTDFYMYYGNPYANSYSNGANTFILFDDFEWGSNGTNISGSLGSVSWTSQQGTAIISTTQTYYGTRSARFAGAATYPNYYTTCSASSDISIMVRFFKAASAQYGPYLIHGNGTYLARVSIDSGEDIAYYYSGAWVDTGSNATSDTWQLLELNNFVYDTYDIWLNTTKIKSTADMDFNSSSSNVLALLNTSTNTGSYYYVYYDNVIVRNWRSVAPSWGSWGSVETNTTDYSNLCVMYSGTNWVIGNEDYRYEFGNEYVINDIFINEGKSKYSLDDGLILLATNKGVIVLEERRGDESNSRVKYFKKR